MSSLGEGDFSRDEGAALVYERYEVSRDQISRDLIPSPDMNRSYGVGGFELAEDDVGRVELDDELREALEDSPMRPRMSGEGSRLSPTKMKRNKGSQSHLMKGSRSTGTLRSPNTYANYS